MQQGYLHLLMKCYSARYKLQGEFARLKWLMTYLPAMNGEKSDMSVVVGTINVEEIIQSLTKLQQ